MKWRRSISATSTPPLPQPKLALCGFARVHLAPRARAPALTMEIPVERFRYWDTTQKAIRRRTRRLRTARRRGLRRHPRPTPRNNHRAVRPSTGLETGWTDRLNNDPVFFDRMNRITRINRIKKKDPLSVPHPVNPVNPVQTLLVEPPPRAFCRTTEENPHPDPVALFPASSISRIRSPS